MSEAPLEVVLQHAPDNIRLITDDPAIVAGRSIVEGRCRASAEQYHDALAVVSSRLYGIRMRRHSSFC